MTEPDPVADSAAVDKSEMVAESDPVVETEPPVAADEQSDVGEGTAESSPKETIKQAIAVLEAEEYAEFLETYVVPSEYAKIKERGVALVVVHFAKSNAPEMLAVMKEIISKDLVPEMSEDGKTAFYDVEQRIASRNTFALVNIDERWYIPNKPPERN
ncbi:hypothetical protein NHH03_05180 [Stieleria sp. TO1_6]|uniref:hypothetical protein n=1 Tax=Stieleria tagensis TaxID=2956795 RepID=UPI00209A9738|nr:hypothetical protein [Stieleria tagensis]MCO8121122.1 hypothetical protein [Stieleria tagensis]